MGIKWEVTMMELEGNGEQFKVTRRMHELGVAETKIFSSKEEAKKQFEEWLQ